ncbi:HVA22-like protein k [Ricinus communis]|uniref:HVA22-like protein n=1 Tax=Ricinus communis TaxID=3988 RepID=B9SGI8_RICCO|nr:HVA22-like protein k [Ricinus communis]EEF37234.1 Receptor expression-enhancing protein, putative [Ricinus communis]|eukprot:XP_002525107.1 HVA22-like protein k [Ricinus communis]
MAFLGSNIPSEVGLRLLLCPLGSNIVIRTACCSVGVVLPVYSTLKAIERKDQNEQQKWLIYWAAYGSFSLVEVFTDKLLYWFPMYYHVKFAFLVWLQLPSTDGAKQIYTNHLRPFFLRHQARVDMLMGFAYDEMGKIVSTHRAEIEYAKAVLLKIMGPAGQTRNGAPDNSGEFPAIEQDTRTSTNTESDHGD